MTDAATHAPARGLAVVPALFGLVRFAHTIFALPFALAGALLAAGGVPSWATLGWIVLAMAGARSLAMAINRLVDARLDAANPRTAGREIPSGRLTRTQVWVFAAASLAALLVSVSQLPRITWYLWPVPVAAFVLYPFTKRFTWGCHLVLGVCTGLAPLAAWVAVTGRFALAPVLLALGVGLWIGGFDVVYALLDLDHDRRVGINSIPVRFGVRRALWITRAMHALAIASLAAAGAAAGTGPLYHVGVAVCGAVLVYEHAIVDPADPGRINRAFGAANMVMAVVFFAFVVADVAW